MSAHTRTHHISHPKRKAPASRSKSTPWREVAKENIKKYGEIGLMVRSSRHKAEMTQKEVAKALEILPHHVSEMEHSKRSVSKDMARKLGRLFNVDYRIFL